jgi:hypothetical protein
LCRRWCLPRPWRGGLAAAREAAFGAAPAGQDATRGAALGEKKFEKKFEQNTLEQVKKRFERFEKKFEERFEKKRMQEQEHFEAGELTSPATAPKPSKLSKLAPLAANQRLGGTTTLRPRPSMAPPSSARAWTPSTSPAATTSVAASLPHLFRSLASMLEGKEKQEKQEEELLE